MQRTSLRHGVNTLFRVMLASLLLLGGGVAAAGGPDDPGHDREPHDRGKPFTPSGGSVGAVPTIVIVPQFFDGRAPVDRDEVREVQDLVFGDSQSVADYYETVSGGRVRLVPGADSRGADDGIVFVPAGESVFIFRSREFADRVALMLDVADPYVDFSTFDADDDGRVTSDELLVLTSRPTRPTFTNNGGKADVLSDSESRGRMDGISARFSVATSTLRTNLATMVHESMHAINKLPDLYGYGTGSYGLAGPTINDDEVHRIIDPFSGLHLGWTDHVRVTSDGWINLEPHVGGGAVAVVDDLVVDDDGYYILENRHLPPDTPAGGRFVYDTRPVDRGLLIWQVRDQFTAVAGTRATPEDLRPSELLRQDGVRVPGCVDEDVDGAIDEDLAMEPKRAIIGGRVDWDDDDEVDDDDDTGPEEEWMGYPVVDSWVDVDKDDKAPERDDSTTISGVRVLGGGVDVNGDGFIVPTLDDGDPWTGKNNDKEAGDERTDEEKLGDGCYSGRDGDAWDATDPLFGARTFTGPADTLGKRVVFRNLWPMNPDDGSLRVFVDVPGPGVLVDAFPAAFSLSGAALEPEFEPGIGRTVFLDVRNTAQSGGTDRFEVTVDAPSGWSATTATVDLAPQTERTVSVRVRGPRRAIGGPVELTATARSLTSGVSSSSTFAGRLLPATREPDRFEPNHTSTDATVLRPTRHEHGTSGPFGGTTERWITTVEELSLHADSDQDVLRLPAPDAGDPADSGHDDLDAFPECGAVSMPDGGRAIASGLLEVNVRTEPAGAPLEILYGGVDRSGPQDRRVAIDCPRTRLEENTGDPDRGVGTTLRLPHDPDVHPLYDLDTAYTWDLLVAPQNATLAREAEEAHGASSLLRLRCPGGFFPTCPDDEPAAGTDLTLLHPIDPGRSCENDGCPDTLFFVWDGLGDLDATFQAPPQFEAQLLDAAGDVVASSFASEGDEPVLFSREGTAQTSDDGTIIHRMLVGDLPTGFYGLRIHGPPMTIAATLTPPETPALELTHVVSDQGALPETGGVVAREVRLRNAHPSLDLDVHALIDETGGAIDSEGTCATPFTLAPGADTTCAWTTPIDGGTPGPTRLSVRADGLLGGELATTAATEDTVTVRDDLPDVTVDVVPRETTVPSGPAEVALDLEITNHGTEDVTLDSLSSQRWLDADGDRDRDADELVRTDLLSECDTPTSIPGGASVDCTVSSSFAGQPWSTPTWRISAGGIEDDANAWGNVVAATVPVAADADREFGRFTVDVETQDRVMVEDDIDGYKVVDAGTEDVLVHMTVAPADQPMLVDRIDMSLDGATGHCSPVSELPQVVATTTRLRAVCHLDGPAPDGLAVAVSVGAGTQTVHRTRRPARPITIEVATDDGALATDTGQLVVKVVGPEDFDARTIDVSTVCFGPAGGATDCSEEHGRLHGKGRNGVVVTHFDGDAIGLRATRAALLCLRGSTDDGAPFEGCDLVEVVEGDDGG